MYLWVSIALLGVLSSCGRSSRDLNQGSHEKPESIRIQIGEFQARGIWTQGGNAMPAILMLPGSGAQGPEERVPANTTEDGAEHSIFDQLAKPFIDAGIHVLQLGKPGVDFFSTWDSLFYDKAMYQSLGWADLITNARAGLDFLQTQPNVDRERIYILGHSEGTQLAVDAATDRKIKGLILLGYSGEDLLTTVSWQMFEREIDSFLKPDVDADKDGFISRSEAEKWKEFRWPWLPGQDKVSIEEVAKFLRADHSRKSFVEKLKTSVFCSDGHCDSGPIYARTVSFPGDLHVFTGELDMQTRASEARRLKELCLKEKKTNCEVEIISGLQHAFSQPKPPRKHPLLDITLGPVSTEFQRRLRELAESLL